MAVLTWSVLHEYDTVTVRQAPESPGVYRLCYRSYDQKYYVFYVGKTGNLRDRLCAHLQDSEPNGCIRQTIRTNRCAFQYLIIPSAMECDRIEREQIGEFKPKCNDL